MRDDRGGVARARLIRAHGYWRVLLFSYLVLPVRGLVAAAWLSEAGVWPVQVLDGIGAGLQSVVVPALVVHLLHGSGRVNAGQGAVATAQGIGAALSPVLGGVLAQRLSGRVRRTGRRVDAARAVARSCALAGRVCGKPADLSATSS